MFCELGIEFELEPIQTRSAAMETAAFRALSQRGKIPLLEDDGLVLGESAAICLYLADRYREHGVFAPEPGTRERALHDELCWFTMTEIDALLYTMRRHEGLPEVYGASEVAVRAARDYCQRSVSEMERRLADGRPFLTGDAFSVADLLFKTCLDWAVMIYQLPLPTALGGYFGAISARSAYGEAMSLNFPPESRAALASTEA